MYILYFIQKKRFIMTTKNSAFGFFEEMLKRSAESDKRLKKMCIKNGWDVNENRLLEKNTNNIEKKETLDKLTVEVKNSDTNEVQNEANEIEKKRVFDKLKTKENIMPQPTPEKVVDETPQATAIPDSYRVLFGGDKR